jgi:hypothetical protein
MVWDIRGSTSLLTDPAFHTVDKCSGPADEGEKGMNAFLKKHKCGVHCIALGIDEPTSKTLAQIKKM